MKVSPPFLHHRPWILISRDQSGAKYGEKGGDGRNWKEEVEKVFKKCNLEKQIKNWECIYIFLHKHSLFSPKNPFLFWHLGWRMGRVEWMEKRKEENVSRIEKREEGEWTKRVKTFHSISFSLFFPIFHSGFVVIWNRPFFADSLVKT